jgi:hypothetical protein
LNSFEVKVSVSGKGLMETGFSILADKNYQISIIIPIYHFFYIRVLKVLKILYIKSFTPPVFWFWDGDRTETLQVN